MYKVGRLLRHELLLKLLMWDEDAANDQLASEIRVRHVTKLDLIGQLVSFRAVSSALKRAFPSDVPSQTVILHPHNHHRP